MYLTARVKTNQDKCFPVKYLSYSEVRKQLFGRVYLETDNDGQFFVNPIYCDKKVTNGVGPGRLPSMGVSGLNTEHVFPKARTLKEAVAVVVMGNENGYSPLSSIGRECKLFQEVVFTLDTLTPGVKSVDGCEESVRGKGAARGGSQIVFLPRKEVRGDVARMVMYFSIGFDVAIQNVEEGMLKDNGMNQTLSTRKVERNSLRYSVQGNRNPFIDFPDLVQYVQDF